jgi:hypothetical protein
VDRRFAAADPVAPGCGDGAAPPPGVRRVGDPTPVSHLRRPSRRVSQERPAPIGCACGGGQRVPGCLPGCRNRHGGSPTTRTRSGRDSLSFGRGASLGAHCHTDPHQPLGSGTRRRGGGRIRSRRSHTPICPRDALERFGWPICSGALTAARDRRTRRRLRGGQSWPVPSPIDDLNVTGRLRASLFHWKISASPDAGRESVCEACSLLVGNEARESDTSSAARRSTATPASFVENQPSVGRAERGSRKRRRYAPLHVDLRLRARSLG